jgi:hypothetical protein
LYTTLHYQMDEPWLTDIALSSLDLARRISCDGSFEACEEAQKALWRRP